MKDIKKPAFRIFGMRVTDVGCVQKQTSYFHKIISGADLWLLFNLVFVGYHGVFGELGHGATSQQIRDTAVGATVLVCLGHEIDVHAQNVFLRAKLLRRYGRLRFKSNLERAEPVYLHALRVLHGTRHRGNELTKHSFDIRTFHSTVLLHYLGQLTGRHRVDHHRTGIPFLVNTTTLVVVLI